MGPYVTGDPEPRPDAPHRPPPVLPPRRVRLGAADFRVHARQYELYHGLYRYAAGFGEVYVDEENSHPYRITYCRVGGEEFGTEQFPVASEEGAPKTGSLALSAYPNPFRERLTAAFEVSQAGPVVVEVVDVLGRVVRVR